jgi:hypothetical protein
MVLSLTVVVVLLLAHPRNTDHAAAMKILKCICLNIKNVLRCMGPIDGAFKITVVMALEK